MRDWMESKEGLHEVRNRTILNVSIVSLCLLIMAIAITEAVGFISSGRKVDSSAQWVAQYQTREDTLFAVDAVTSRGLILIEFMAALEVSDVYTADSIRTRLMAARELLLSDGLLGFPKDIRTDLARLLAAYSTYGLNTGAANLISFDPQQDSKILLNGLQSLRAYQKNWVANVAAMGLNERRFLHSKSFIIVILILLCFIPLLGGTISSRRFAKEHQQLSKSRDYFVGLIDNLPGLVLLTTRSGEIITVNKAVSEFLGY